MQYCGIWFTKNAMEGVVDKTKVRDKIGSLYSNPVFPSYSLFTGKVSQHNQAYG